MQQIRARILNLGTCMAIINSCIHTLCMRATKALESLHICADSPDPSLLVDATNTRLSCTDLYQILP